MVGGNNMQFLIENGFKKSTIEKLQEKYDESILDVVSLEEENVKEVINYLKQIGIQNIEDLMIYQIELFTKDIDKIKKHFDKPNQYQMVEKINEDVMNIDKV